MAKQGYVKAYDRAQLNHLVMQRDFAAYMRQRRADEVEADGQNPSERAEDIHDL